MRFATASATHGPCMFALLKRCDWLCDSALMPSPLYVKLFGKRSSTTGFALHAAESAAIAMYRSALSILSLTLRVTASSLVPVATLFEAPSDVARSWPHCADTTVPTSLMSSSQASSLSLSLLLMSLLFSRLRSPFTMSAIFLPLAIAQLSGFTGAPVLNNPVNWLYACVAVSGLKIVSLALYE